MWYQPPSRGTCLLRGSFLYLYSCSVISGFAFPFCFISFPPESISFLYLRFESGVPFLIVILMHCVLRGASEDHCDAGNAGAVALFRQ
jgi:hypothetical protein